jgi:hypothetical protein
LNKDGITPFVISPTSVAPLKIDGNLTKISKTNILKQVKTICSSFVFLELKIQVVPHYKDIMFPQQKSVS